MKLKFVFLNLVICFQLISCAQFSGNNNPYIFSAEIYDSIKSNPKKWIGGITAPMLSFIGLYKEALILHNKSRMYVQKISKKDSADFLKNYHAIDARQYIIEKAKINRVIIINEAHYNPRNRVFVASLLNDLKKIGYDYYAAEGFWNNEKFPKLYPAMTSGYYMKEPQFGNLIREAIKQNFALIPYEDTSGASGKLREINQAKNLVGLLQKNPSTKVIIYCGYAHVHEDSIGGNWEKAMAGRLKEFTGIDPFTIDQTVLIENANHETNSPEYRIIDQKKYSFLVDSMGKLYTNGHVDALLYSPQTRYIYNRPHWIFENNKKPYLLKNLKPNLDFPFLVKVYLNEEEIKNSYVPIRHN